jgi:hypothetical protein
VARRLTFSRAHRDINSFVSLEITPSDTMNNGMSSNNNNTYIGNFRVQQQNDNSTSPHQQMMSQMTDGFKPFYKKYE